MPFLAGLALLATPHGQRTATAWALQRIQHLLPESAGPTELDLGGVHMSASPLGIALSDVVWQKSSPESDTLLHLESLTALPLDATGLQWSSLKVDGLHAHAGLWPWLSAVLSAEESARSTAGRDLDVHVKQLEVSNVTWASGPDVLPDFFIEDGSINSLLISDLNVINRSLRYMTLDGQADFSVRHALGAQATLDVAFDATDTALNWTITPQLDEADSFPGTWGDILPWWPDQIQGEWHPLSSELTARISGEWGQAEGAATLDPHQWTLQHLSVDMPRPPVDLHPLPEGHLFCRMTGPMGIPRNDTIPLSLNRITGDLAVAGAISRRGNSPLRAAIRWTPSSGAIAIDAALSEDALEETAGHAGHITASGRLDWHDSHVPSSLDLNGDWALSKATGAPAFIAAEGQWSLSTATEKDGMRFQINLDGSAMPLALTPQLELYGDVRLQASASIGNLPSDALWTGQLEFIDTRWIPKAGFGQHTAASAPLSMKRFSMHLRGEGNMASCHMEGDFLRGVIKGPMDRNAWVAPLKNTLAEAGWLTGSPSPSSLPWSVQLEVLRDDLLERWSAGQQSIGPGSRIVGDWDGHRLLAEVEWTGAHFGPWRSGKTQMQLRHAGGPPKLSLHMESPRHADMGQLTMLDFQVHSSAPFSTLGNLTWEGPVSGAVAVQHTLEPSGQHHLEWLNGKADVMGSLWHLDSTLAATMRWGEDWTSMEVMDWTWKGDLGTLTLDRPDDEVSMGMAVRLDGWPLDAWRQWGERVTGAPCPALTGNLNGTALLNLNPLQVLPDLQWQDAGIGDYAFGDLCAQGGWTHDSWWADAQQFEQQRPTSRMAVDALGRLEADLERWPLSTLDPLLAKGGVHVEGTLDGHLDVDFSGKRPLPRGQLTFTAPLVEVEATGGPLGVEGILSLTPDYIGLDHATVTDGLGGIAYLNLSVLHTDFAEWNYDVDLDFSEGPFRLMDLDPAPGRLFHGVVTATGGLNLFGDGHGVIIESELKSEPGTAFVLPLDALEGAELPSGIRFVGGRSEAAAPKRKSPFGVTLNLEVDVTPDADLAIVLDSQAGERVDGRANGLLEIGMSPEVPLFMEGGLQIVEGAYRFSLRDLFTRRIAIAPGGRLDWDGDPYAAELDLTAISRHRANPLPLLPGLVNPGQTPVEVAMGIQGALEAPDLQFAVRFPEYEASDAALLAQVQSALAAPEEVERQAFALLATGQFIPAGGAANLFSQTASTQASELLSSRVSELLSGLSEDLDIGVRYVPANALNTSSGSLGGGDNPDVFRSEDAFELDLGLNLLNDRLNIAGTLGAQGMDGLSLEGSEFRGGVDVRYKLTPDGRWEIQGYRLPESELDEEPRQGIGAAYQLRFDRLRDLFSQGTDD